MQVAPFIAASAAHQQHFNFCTTTSPSINHQAQRPRKLNLPSKKASCLGTSAIQSTTTRTQAEAQRFAVCIHQVQWLVRHLIDNPAIG
jgi:hypothetical protein